MARIVQAKVALTEFTYGDLSTGFSVSETAEVRFTIAASTTVDVIGGSSPQIPFLSTVTMLALHTDKEIRYVVQGADISTEYLTVAANGFEVKMNVSLTALKIRNNSASDTATVTIQAGGS